MEIVNELLEQQALLTRLYKEFKNSLSLFYLRRENNPNSKCRNNLGPVYYMKILRCDYRITEEKNIQFVFNHCRLLNCSDFLIILCMYHKCTWNCAVYNQCHVGNR